VPEKREERTTEGGLDVVGQEGALGPRIARLKAAGCRVSLFIEPDEAPIATAAKLGAPVIELHTGSWCEAHAHGETEKAEAAFRRLAEGAALGAKLNLEVHAGHGLDYDTARLLAAVPAFVEFNIGHFLIGEAIFIGLEAAIRRMRQAMDEGRAAIQVSA
jgi:pyridoxine 5-phosphate synthase